MLQKSQCPLNVLQAMNWMGSSWANVEVTTISKCFAAAGFSNTGSQAAQRQDENENPLSDLHNEFQNLID